MNKVILARDHNGIKVDHKGTLTGSNFRGRKFILDGLSKHIEEMGRRYYGGDVAAVDEFLQLYCAAQDARAEAKQRQEA